MTTPHITMKPPVTAPAPTAREVYEMERVYVWDVVVRVTHWVIALSILALTLTGIYIGDPYLLAPGEAGERFTMGTVRVIHFYGAIAFSVAVFARVVWMFIGSPMARWTQFLPVQKQRLIDLWKTIKFYTFFRRNPPHNTGHNPLAGLAYAFVYAMFGLMILTGIGLYAASADSYMANFAFLLDLLGGAQTARWLHHMSMWVIVLFFVIHLYTSLATALVERNGTLDSIFSGFKWIRRKRR